MQPAPADPTATATAPELPAACPNCGAPVFGPYCAQCGQETVIAQLTLRTFGHEYIQSFVSLDGRLWRTLWLLLRHPGKLTTEFLAGRRRRYVRPLPLYFSTSFVLFLLMAIVPGKWVQFDDGDFGPSSQSAGATLDKPRKQSAVRLSTRPPVAAASAAGATGAASAASAAKPAMDLEAKDWPQALRPLVARARLSSDRLKSDPDAGAKRLSAAMLAKLPYAIFALVPAFAACTRLVYWRRRRNYAEHFLFALHLHSFAFLTMLATYPFGNDEVIPPLTLGWLVYLVLALRQMFGGRWWPQVPRALLLGLMYSLVLGLVMAAAVLLSFLTL